MPVKSLCLKENPSESVRFRRIFVKKRTIAQQKLFANATAPKKINIILPFDTGIRPRRKYYAVTQVTAHKVWLQEHNCHAPEFDHNSVMVLKFCRQAA